MNYDGKEGPCLPWGRISTTCIISMLRNDTNISSHLKYIQLSDTMRLYHLHPLIKYIISCFHTQPLHTTHTEVWYITWEIITNAFFATELFLDKSVKSIWVCECWNAVKHRCYCFLFFRNINPIYIYIYIFLQWHICNCFGIDLLDTYQI